MTKSKNKRNKDKSQNQGSGVILISENRRARRDYDLNERYEAGIILTGTEVKSCRNKKAHVNDAYVQIKNGEAFIIGSHIAVYPQGGHFNHAPDRVRKLLLKRTELHKMDTKIRAKGFVAIPLRLYFKGGFVKVEIAIGKGRTHSDKREHNRERDTNREMQRAFRRGGR